MVNVTVSGSARMLVRLMTKVPIWAASVASLVAAMLTVGLVALGTSTSLVDLEPRAGGTEQLDERKERIVGCVAGGDLGSATGGAVEGEHVEIARADVAGLGLSTVDRPGVAAGLLRAAERCERDAVIAGGRG